MSVVAAPSKFWKKAVGTYSVERKALAIMEGEAFSVRALFDTLVSQAFTRPIAVRTFEGGYERWEMWGEGTRPWSQRDLATAAGMCVTTLRKGLKQLAKLKLIRVVISNRTCGFKGGTVVQVQNYFRIRKQGYTKVSAPPPQMSDKQLTPFFSHRGDTVDTKPKPYKGSINIDHRSLPNSVDVTPTETSKIFMNEEEKAKTRRFLQSIGKPVPNWA